MATPADVRKIALAFEGVSEIDHWGRRAWRTPKRIFAVLRPDGLYLNLPRERKEFLFEASPETFAKMTWGKSSHILVQFARMPPRELAHFIREAWEYNRPPPPKKTEASARSCVSTRRKADGNLGGRSQTESARPASRRAPPGR